VALPIGLSSTARGNSAVAVLFFKIKLATLISFVLGQKLNLYHGGVWWCYGC